MIAFLPLFLTVIVVQPVLPISLQGLLGLPLKLLLFMLSIWGADD